MANASTTATAAPTKHCTAKRARDFISLASCPQPPSSDVFMTRPGTVGNKIFNANFGLKPLREGVAQTAPSSSSCSLPVDMNSRASLWFGDCQEHENFHPFNFVDDSGCH